MAALSVAAFSVIVCVNLDPFTYTGTTAIFFALNFAPTCFLIYMKKQWNDINIKLLYHKLAKDMKSGLLKSDCINTNEGNQERKLENIAIEKSLVDVKTKFR
jgi:hypothetical protein